MEDARRELGWARGALVGALAVLTLGVGLGRSGRLSYHEAFVAQAAREMTATGDWLVPKVGGQPWLEKPPLAVWLVALAGQAAGGITETAARAPSAAAGGLLALGVACFAARRFGPGVGLLAGLIQATTVWTVLRGRLAEADMVLACLITWCIVLFDRFRGESGAGPGQPAPPRLARVALFALLGLSALSKGVGFGGALLGASLLFILIWDRDRSACRRLAWGMGAAGAALLALAWPALVIQRHPQALDLWTLHVADRLATRPEHFAGEAPWWGYVPTLFMQSLPWTPLAIGGAVRSLGRACGRSGRFGADRLLWAWAVAPVALLSLATVKNAHYAIHALPPWSVWAALGLVRLGERFQQRGVAPARLRRAVLAGFAGLGLACALGFTLLGPRTGGRGVEWVFYARAAQVLSPGEPVILLYNVPDWDRYPYPTPFGPVPHDLAVRLYYLNRPALCRYGTDDLAAHPPAPPSSSFAVIGRESDLPGLKRLGRVETLAVGPSVRRDRNYRLYRITPGIVVTEEEDSPRRTQRPRRGKSS